MTRAVASSIAVSVLAAVVCVSAQDPPQTTFRSAASAVTVDVTVRDRSRRAITGLKASDFQVFDHGVAQKVDEVSYGKLPIDVTIALDVSYSVTGDVLERLRRGVVQLTRDLGRSDRLKLVLFNMRANRTVDYTNDARLVERAIRSATPGGGTALYDAISVTLVSASSSPPDRRQLVAFFTDGSDSSSTTSPAVLTVVAQRTRATLAFVVPTAFDTTADRFGTQTTITFSGKVRSAINPALAALAQETGGAVVPAGPSANLTQTFKTLLDDFRSAYVLYYTPRGVERSGYHPIEVRVNRDGAQVQARRGYFSPGGTF